MNAERIIHDESMRKQKEASYLLLPKGWVSHTPSSSPPPSTTVLPLRLTFSTSQSCLILCRSNERRRGLALVRNRLEGRKTGDVSGEIRDLFLTVGLPDQNMGRREVAGGGIPEHGFSSSGPAGDIFTATPTVDLSYSIIERTRNSLPNTVVIFVELLPVQLSPVIPTLTIYLFLTIKVLLYYYVITLLLMRRVTFRASPIL